MRLGNRNKPDMRGAGTMSYRQARKAISGRRINGGPPTCQRHDCTKPGRVLDNTTGLIWCMGHQPKGK
jgi:hypothetical protein